MREGPGLGGRQEHLRSLLAGLHATSNTLTPPTLLVDIQQGLRSLTRARPPRPPCPRLFLPPSHLLPLGHLRYRRWASKWAIGGSSQEGWSAILQEEGTISLHVLQTMGTHL